MIILLLSFRLKGNFEQVKFQRPFQPGDIKVSTEIWILRIFDRFSSIWNTVGRYFI